MHRLPEGHLMADYLDHIDAEAVAKATDDLRANHPELVEQAGGNVRLALYLTQVDRVLVRLVGIRHRDLADFGWADAFANETKPKDAAMEALEADDLYGALALAQ